MLRAIVITVIVLGAAAPIARAQEDVASIVERGVELRRAGRDREALAEFKRALAIQKTPKVQAQVALAEQALGLWVEAEQDLLPIVEQKADPWIRKNFAALGKALAVIQGHLGLLDVWGAPDGAEVYVNRTRVGTLPLEKPIRVAEGTVLLAARADGYIESSRTVAVAAGATAREHVELLRNVTATEKGAQVKAEPAARTQASLDARSEGQPREARRPSATAETRTAADVTATEDRVPAGRPAVRGAAWVTGVGAAAALAFGIVETLARSHDRAAFNDFALPNPADPTHPMTSYCNTNDLKPECRPLQDAYNRSNTLMIVGYASAGALAVSSAVLFWLSSSDSAEHARSTASRVALVCSPQFAAGQPGAACRLTF